MRGLSDFSLNGPTLTAAFANLIAGRDQFISTRTNVLEFIPGGCRVSMQDVSIMAYIEPRYLWESGNVVRFSGKLRDWLSDDLAVCDFLRNAELLPKRYQQPVISPEWVAQLQNFRIFHPQSPSTLQQVYYSG